MDSKKTLDANGGGKYTKVMMNRKRKSALLQKIHKIKLLVNRDKTSWHCTFLSESGNGIHSEHTHIRARIVCLLSVYYSQMMAEAPCWQRSRASRLI